MTFTNLKTVNDDFEVEFEILPPEDIVSDTDPRRQAIIEAKNQVDGKLEDNLSKIEELNKEIYSLTNHSDGLDYMVAVGSGTMPAV